MKKLFLPLCLLVFLFCCCKESREQRISRLVEEWEGRQIVYPLDMVFTMFGKDTVDYTLTHSEYTIVSYVDSLGCVSCKLQLDRWKKFIAEVNSVTGDSIPFIFVLHPKDRKEISYILKRDRFAYPVCIDEEDLFNTLNEFPSDMTFQTFLLNKDNCVIAVGNPIHNHKVKELYLQMLTKQQDGVKSTAMTEVEIDKTIGEMGDFDWTVPQTILFTLSNTGENRLVVDDVDVSCGCTSVTFGKEPVPKGKTLELKVVYKAEQPEHFDKTVTVHCNAFSSPILLHIRGNAVEK